MLFDNKQPREHFILDLFCGAGGASVGLAAAGFTVIGVDIEPQLHYPFILFQADALEFDLDKYKCIDAFWASPPCQAYSWSAKRWHKDYPELIEPIREKLIATGKPYIIENVFNSPLRNPIQLTGLMFGLHIIRKRWFECSFYCLSPAEVKKQGAVKTGEFVTVAGHGGDGKASLKDWAIAMGIGWMNRKEITQAVPPIYAEFLGKQLIKQCDKI